jgi:hypothetical protein
VPGTGSTSRTTRPGFPTTTRDHFAKPIAAWGKPIFIRMNWSSMAAGTPGRSASTATRPRTTSPRGVAPVESRGAAILNGDIIALTDLPPDPLTNVAGPWRLVLEPVAAIVHG